MLDTVARVEWGASGGAPATAKVSFLDMPAIEISSSQVRRRAARGEPIVDLVGAAVADYISEQRLYRRVSEARA